MNSSKKYTAAIIGAGRIGSGFDAPQSHHVLTHAHAVSNNSRIRLVGLVDTNQKVGKREAKRWGTQLYPTVEKLFLHHTPDIVIIATPDHTHVSLLKKLSKYKPKLIICEKPVVTDTRSLVAVKKLRLPPVIINYSRRFDPTTLKVKEEFARGRYGSVIALHGVYSGGLLHNGSHMAHLAQFLLGRDANKLTMTAGDARAYSLFELDILAEKARVRFIEGGACLSIELPRTDPTHAGFRTLGPAHITKTKLQDALPNLYRHALAVLDGKEKAAPNLHEALLAERSLL